MMIGTLINAGAILVGTLIGLLLRKGIPQRLQDSIGQGQGLCVILIGLSSAVKTADITCVIICMVIGSLLGAWIDIEQRLNDLGKSIERRVSPNGAEGSIAKGFVTASLVFCVGAMAIVGSMDSGLRGDHSTLIAKSILDGVFSIFPATNGSSAIYSKFRPPSGLRLMLQPGPSTTLTPAASASRPMAAPSAAYRSGFHAAPAVTAAGKHVAGSELLTPTISAFPA